ncbi:MAG: hypothetical protein ABI216_01860 [Devosia sp.]
MANSLPFENRWSSGKAAEHWHQELGRLGVPNVRMMFAVGFSEGDPDKLIVGDIPSGFVSDWLAFYDRRGQRQELLWRAAVLALTLIAAVAAIIAAIRG